MSLPSFRRTFFNELLRTQSELCHFSYRLRRAEIVAVLLLTCTENGNKLRLRDDNNTFGALYSRYHCLSKWIEKLNDSFENVLFCNQLRGILKDIPQKYDRSRKNRAILWWKSNEITIMANRSEE